jgi:hypothetical protein
MKGSRPGYSPQLSVDVAFTIHILFSSLLFSSLLSSPLLSSPLLSSTLLSSPLLSSPLLSSPLLSLQFLFSVYLKTKLEVEQPRSEVSILRMNSRYFEDVCFLGYDNDYALKATQLLEEYVASTFRLEEEEAVKIPAWKQVAICSSETSVDFQLATRHYNAEHKSVYNHRCENLKEYVERTGENTLGRFNIKMDLKAICLKCVG